MSSTLVEMFDAAVRRAPPQRSLLTGRVSLTYGEVRDRAAKLAGWLAERKVAPGDRVAIVSRHEREVVSLFLALLRNGVTSVILDPMGTPETWRNLVAAARCRGVFADAECAAELSAACADAWLVEIAAPGSRTLFQKLLGGRSSPSGSARLPELWDHLRPAASLPAEVPAETPGLLTFTSGSTHRPRGVVLSHANLAAHMTTLARQYGLDEGSRQLNHVSLHHVDGILHGALLAFLAGGELVREGPFTVQRVEPFLEAVYLHRVTHMYTVPTVLALLHRLAGAYRDSFRTSDFRFVISGVGRLDETLWRGFEDDFGTRVVGAYGHPETVSQSLFSGPDDASRKLGSLGKPVDCRTRVVDPEGRDVEPGATGELWISGAHVSPGYFDDPAATAAAFPGGWFRTGDLVHVDAGGHHYLDGRTRDVILRGGVVVHPEDVSRALLKVQGVRDAVAVGVDDPTWEQRIVTCVVTSAPRGAEEVRHELQGHLSQELLPDELHVVDAIPRSDAGRVLVPELLAKLRAPAPASAPAGDDLLPRIAAIAARCFGVPVDQLSRDSTPEKTLGWDSLAHMTFVSALEEAFAIRLEFADIMELTTLAAAERIVAEKQAEVSG